MQTSSNLLLEEMLLSYTTKTRITGSSGLYQRNMLLLNLQERGNKYLPPYKNIYISKYNTNTFSKKWSTWNKVSWVSSSQHITNTFCEHYQGGGRHVGPIFYFKISRRSLAKWEIIQNMMFVSYHKDLDSLFHIRIPCISKIQAKHVIFQ